MEKTKFGKMEHYCFDNMPMIIEAIKFTLIDVENLVYSACEDLLLPLTKLYFGNSVIIEKRIRWRVMEKKQAYLYMTRDILLQSGRHRFRAAFGFASDSEIQKPSNTIYLWIEETNAKYAKSKEPKIIDEEFKKRLCEKKPTEAGFRIEYNDGGIWVEFDVKERDLSPENIKKGLKYYETLILKPLYKQL